MSQTSMLTARIDPELKTEAENILGQLGLPAITLFYKQIVLRRALPFPVALDVAPPPSLADMTRRDFDRELELAETAIHEGRTQSADTVKNDVPPPPGATRSTSSGSSPT